jgi:hypothetical protein
MDRWIDGGKHQILDAEYLPLLKNSKMHCAAGAWRDGIRRRDGGREREEEGARERARERIWIRR